MRHRIDFSEIHLNCIWCAISCEKWSGFVWPWVVYEYNNSASHRLHYADATPFSSIGKVSMALQTQGTPISIRCQCSSSLAVCIYSAQFAVIYRLEINSSLYLCTFSADYCAHIAQSLQVSANAISGNKNPSFDWYKNTRLVGTNYQCMRSAANHNPFGHSAITASRPTRGTVSHCIGGGHRCPFNILCSRWADHI